MASTSKIDGEKSLPGRMIAEREQNPPQKAKSQRQDGQESRQPLGKRKEQSTRRGGLPKHARPETRELTGHPTSRAAA